MIRSMTGFGQGARNTGGFRIAIDMKSVNHRYAEVMIRMPREWLALEEPLRKLVQQRVKRGRVDVFVQLEPESLSGRTAQVDWPLAEGYRQAAEQIRQRLQLAGDIAIRDLLAIPDLVRLSDPSAPSPEQIESEFLDCAREALDRLIGMRETEGGHLQRDLAERLDSVQRIHENIRTLAPQAVEEHRNKLRSRIQELLDGFGAAFDEQRFVMEVALFAERSNVDEELTRLESHCHQFALLLDEREPVGRKLDFLIQEMNREANTIGSKANHATMAGQVVELKAELEKIREQAQNIE